MKSNDKEPKPVVSRNNFINFLASATPEEINQYISEKGKPGKLIDPMNIYSEKKKKEIQQMQAEKANK